MLLRLRPFLTLLILISVLWQSCSLPRVGITAFLNLAARWSALLWGSLKSRGSVRKVNCSSSWESSRCREMKGNTERHLSDDLDMQGNSTARNGILLDARVRQGTRLWMED